MLHFSSINMSVVLRAVQIHLSLFEIDNRASFKGAILIPKYVSGVKVNDIDIILNPLTPKDL
jgi:hypothetical protein